MSASLDVLAGTVPNAGMAKAIEAAPREALAAALPAAAREAAAQGLENVRKIVIPPPSVHVDMPPLRR